MQMGKEITHADRWFARFVRLALVMSCFTFLVPDALAQPVPEVVLHAKGGSTSQAVLLHMDDDGVFVDLLCNEWDTEQFPDLAVVRYFRSAVLDSIVVPGEAGATFGEVVLGALYGALGGMLLAATLAVTFEGPKKDSDTPAVAAQLGLIGGSILGVYFVSSWNAGSDAHDRSYVISDSDDRLELRRLCVYPDELPGELRARTTTR